MWVYCIWIPAVVIYYLIYAWCSKRYNDTPTALRFWVLYLTNLFPVWMIVARYSKDMLFDGVLYDILAFSAFIAGLILLGSGDRFTMGQWIGLVVVVVGFLMMKLC